MREKILAFYSPYPGAGKSTAGKFLSQNRYYSCCSFADPIYAITNYILTDLGGNGTGSVRQHDLYASSKDEPLEILGGACIRDMLIAFGQAGRKVYPDIWVSCMKDRLNFTNLVEIGRSRIVIDDLRFPNEYKMLREKGVKIVRITNPNREIVPSETEALLEGYEFDAEIVNDKQDLDKYHAQLDKLLAEL